MDTDSLWLDAGSSPVRSRSAPDRTGPGAGGNGVGCHWVYCFFLLTSNPLSAFCRGFRRGQDLNPLLQDPGDHPSAPAVYGLCRVFRALRVCHCSTDGGRAGYLGPMVPSRTNVAWGFLSLGIMLGSWWAYYELGWGGWWFWDPVENASFMPWLVGTALVHSLAVTEKRGLFRSGRCSLPLRRSPCRYWASWSARCSDLGARVCGRSRSRTLYPCFPRHRYWRITDSLCAQGSHGGQCVQYGAFSREALLLANNFIFVISAATVLLGTLFPLIMDALGRGKYSVGPPYFNTVFVP